MGSMDMRTYLNQKCKKDKVFVIVDKIHNGAEPVFDQVVSKKEMEVKIRKLMKALQP